MEFPTGHRTRWHRPHSTLFCIPSLNWPALLLLHCAGRIATSRQTMNSARPSGVRKRVAESARSLRFPAKRDAAARGVHQRKSCPEVVHRTSRERRDRCGDRGSGWGCVLQILTTRGNPLFFAHFKLGDAAGWRCPVGSI
ncbi:hypothetical protein XF_2738 [Xylella fastidiosa 9a5c]|uniref:Uncharacterized protein n=1 Tax=Xylella fastidiosa (strain 9a5c) TaxID=160492 RepID=Q9P9Y2_XYLFA|nr:hypothetical protein XF_2738 [Xylella fastidiosa 9a5c]